MRIIVSLVLIAFLCGCALSESDIARLDDAELCRAYRRADAGFLLFRNADYARELRAEIYRRQTGHDVTPERAADLPLICRYRSTVIARF